MKVEVTHARICSDTDIVATVEKRNEFQVEVRIKESLGWKDWYELTDAVRKAVVMMEVQQ